MTRFGLQPFEDNYFFIIDVAKSRFSIEKRFQNGFSKMSENIAFWSSEKIDKKASV
jgi:hypothetical protein